MFTTESALKIAIDLRMTHGGGEASFIAARDTCRAAQKNGSNQTARLYSKVGALLVDLGELTQDRALELLKPAITIG